MVDEAQKLKQKRRRRRRRWHASAFQLFRREDGRTARNQGSLPRIARIQVFQAPSCSNKYYLGTLFSSPRAHTFYTNTFFLCAKIF